LALLLVGISSATSIRLLTAALRQAELAVGLRVAAVVAAAVKSHDRAHL
jgi:hypothetical protein